MTVKKLNHCVYALSYHLVLVTKYRRRCLSSKMLAELRQVLNDQLALKGGALVELNGEADHVHLLMEVPPSVALSVVVNNLKTVSSRLLRKWNEAELSRFYCDRVLWSGSYFLGSVGGASLATVKAYIEGQAAPE
jgi:putative transposase